MKGGSSAVQEGDEVVVAGIGGRLPGRQNWFQDEADRGGPRWTRGFCGIKNDVATLTNIDKFDSGAFRVHSRMAATLDPQCRLMLEVVWEAIVDAGYNPENLRGSKTAVWVACNRSETGEALCGKDEQDGYLVLGNCRAMYSNRVSYAFDFKGHSVTVDGGGASSGSLLYTAVQYLEEGKCDYAVVGATNLIFKPGVQLGLELTAESTKLTRGEAVIAVVLTKKSLSIRPYCQVKGVSCTWLGSPPQEDQIKSAIMKTYLAAHVDPDTVDKVDLATIPGFDTAERYVTTKIFSSDKMGEDRKVDYESAAGLFALLQASLLLHRDQLKLVGINDLGRTGNFSHIILSRVSEKGLPRTVTFEDEEMKHEWCEHDVRNRLSMKRVSHPKLSIKFKDKQRSLSPLMRKSRTEPTVCCTADRKPAAGPADISALAPTDRPQFGEGRTEEAVRAVLEFCAEKEGTGEGRMLQDCMIGANSIHLPFRGYQIGKVVEIRQSPSSPPPIWLICSGVGSQWVGMLKQYSQNPLCAEILEDLTQLLLMHSFDLTRLVYSEDIRLFDDPKSLFVGLAVVQCLQIELLRAHKIPIVGVLGHSFGEHAAAFAAGCLNRHEFILTAHARGKVVSLCESGAMAVVACSWEEAKDIAVKFEVEVACDNAPKLVTMSGLQSNIFTMLDNLHQQGIFARLIKSGNRAFHSSLVKPATPKFTAKLHRIISEIREPSIQWLSSSGQAPFSREYLSNNLQLPVRFTGAATKIPSDALLLEIGAHPVIKPMLRDLPNTLIFLSAKDKPDTSFGRTLGELYLHGHKIYSADKGLDLSKSGPVGHVVRWEHSQSWYTPKYDEFMTVPTLKPENTLHSKTFTFNLDGKDKYLYGHKIDNTSIFPGAGYLTAVLDTITDTMKSTNQIELSDVTFARALPLSGDKVSLKVHLDVALKVFVVEEQDNTYCRGQFKISRSNHKNPQSKYGKGNMAEEDWVSSQAFYNEMKLRGYCYEDDFKMITKYRQTAELDVALVNWDQGKKVLLIDSILQSSVFNNNKRKLALPSRITRIIFDCVKYKEIQQQSEVKIEGNPKFDCWNAQCLFVYKVAGTVVERKSKEEVVMMTEQLTPILRTNSKESVLVTEYRKQLQIVESENLSALKNTVILNSLKSGESPISLSEVLGDILFNSVMVKETLKSALDIAFGYLDQRVTIFIVSPDFDLGLKEYEKLFPSKNLVIKTFENLQSLFELLTSNGTPSSTLLILNHAFKHATIADDTRTLNEIIVRDTIIIVNQVNKLTGLDEILVDTGEIVAVEKVFPRQKDIETLWRREGVNCQAVMVRKRQGKVLKQIEVDDEGSFLTGLKNKLSSADKREIVLSGSGGEIGLARCLKQEHLPVRHSAIPTQSDAGEVPGTYTYSPLLERKIDKIEVSEERDKIAGFFCEVLSPGDMTSLTWTKTLFSKEAVRVTFSALNFRDPMVASRRLNVATLPYDGNSADLKRLGIEYSGTTVDGQNVMGIVPCQGLATHIEGFSHLRWTVPERLSLADASTLPLAYCTAYYGLVARAGLQPGQSVLVHCGAGAVGTAALRIAFNRGCEVWTTVSSADKRNYLLSIFPDLKRENIGHSRSQNFVKTVLNGTRGKGVDVVLNSLSGKLLLASARCVKTGGHFVEIGKYDMQTNSPLPATLMMRGCQIHGVQLDELWREQSRAAWSRVHRLFAEGLESGEVVPLQYTVFTDVARALKFITSGKHKGKVIIKIKDDEDSGDETSTGESRSSDNLTQPAVTNAVYITEFRPDQTGKYLVTGGLGALGIELATWLVDAGCSVVLSGRTQPSPGTQLALNALKSAGTCVTLELGDVTDEEFVDRVFSSHKIVGVFHLAGALHDTIFSAMTPESWRKVVRVKVQGARNLDRACRKFSDQISTFVCFSSIVAAFGNAGQSSYGYANSAVDNICRERVKEGLPATSIQWGLINVGMGVSIKQVCGSAAMSIPCFQKCLQKILQYELRGVVLVYVPFKQAPDPPGEGAALLSRVSRVLGVKDLLSHGDTLLSRFGLDSLMAVELAALLSRDAGVNLAPDKIRDLTFSALHTICST